jgi:hypothetical protein
MNSVLRQHSRPSPNHATLFLAKARERSTHRKNEHPDDRETAQQVPGVAATNYGEAILVESNSIPNPVTNTSQEK